MKRPERKPPPQAGLRKHLNADALIAGVRRDGEKLSDFRNVSPKIPIADVAMSAFAMFSLKDPSLLAFQKRWTARDHNLHKKAEEVELSARLLSANEMQVVKPVLIGLSP